MEVLSRANALAQGVSYGKLRGKRWQRVSYDLFVPASVQLGGLERLRCLVLILPVGAAFSGLTAAWLYGWWLPPLPERPPVFVTVNPDGPRPGRRELSVRRATLPPEDVVRLHGLPVTSPLRTLLDLASVLSLVDLVVIADAALRQGDITLAELIAAANRESFRGIRTHRRMTTLADARSQSAWETVLRLVHVLSGIPVEVQAQILDPDGGWIATADLQIQGTRQLPEYDGSNHRDRAQHQRDLQRDKLLHRAGYARFPYIAKEILGHPQVIVADAEDALGWQRQCDRVDAWLVEFERSLFSRAGMARWRRRWCEP